MASPPHLLRRETIDIVLRDDGGLCGRFGAFTQWRRKTLRWHGRRQRRGLRARGQRDRTRAKSKGKFQKVAAFHDISLFVYGE